MTSETELMNRNIEISAEFSHYLFEHPEVEVDIPVDAELILLPEYDAELKEFNLKIGKRIESEGGRVMYVVIKHIRPKSFSRIDDLKLEPAL